MVKAIVLGGLVCGLAALTGCAGNGGAATGETGIGSEAGRMAGYEIGGKHGWLGGEIGSRVGRQTEKGVTQPKGGSTQTK